MRLTLVLCLTMLVFGASVTSVAGLNANQVTDDDLNWIALVVVASGYLVQDMNNITAAANNLDFDALSYSCALLYGHADTAKKMGDGYTVSSQYRSTKREFDYALDDCKTAALYGYEGAEERDADKLTLATQYLARATEHIQKSMEYMPDN